MYQVQVKKTTTPVTKQTSEDDEISRIKKQNKNTPTQAETLEERQPIVPTTPIHTTPTRETEREPDDPLRRSSVARYFFFFLSTSQYTIMIIAFIYLSIYSIK